MDFFRRKPADKPEQEPVEEPDFVAEQSNAADDWADEETAAGILARLRESSHVMEENDRAEDDFDAAPAAAEPDTIRADPDIDSADIEEIGAVSPDAGADDEDSHLLYPDSAEEESSQEVEEAPDVSPGFDKRIATLRQQLEPSRRTGAPKPFSAPLHGSTHQDRRRTDPVERPAPSPSRETPLRDTTQDVPNRPENPPARAESEPAEARNNAQLVEVPTPSPGHSARRAGRVKTRLLGFEHSGQDGSDPFAAAKDAAEPEERKFPVGWIVVVKGPGRGTAFTLYSGVSQIGRGSDQAVKLDFGDTTISRNNHAVVAYDPEQRKHFLGHGGKANIVRLNDMPVLSTETLTDGDLIRIGETTLRFVELCGRDFDWNATKADDEHNVANL
ncbi:MAG: FHA domain-containing protein [Paracoccaceae bacterium]